MKVAPQGGHPSKNLNTSFLVRLLYKCTAVVHFETRFLSYSCSPDGTRVSTARNRVVDAINGFDIVVRPWLTKIKCQNRVLVRFSPSNGEVENAVNPVLRKTGVKA